MQTTLTDTQLLKLYALVFPRSIQDTSKAVATIHDILFLPTYCFKQQPYPNWKSEVMQYLLQIGYDVSSLSMNTVFDEAGAIN